MKIFASLAALLSLFFAPTAWAEEPIKIGVMAPVTGQWASEGQDMVNIVKLLAEQFNAAGGAQGRLVEIEVGDDGGDPKTAVLAAQRLVDLGVVAAIGTYGSAITEATQDIYADEDVLQIGTGSTSIRLTEKGLPLFFRTSPRDDDQGKVMARYVQSLGFKRAALLHDNSSYAKGLADEVRGLLKDTEVQIVFDDAITPGDRDYSTTLSKIKTASPDVLIFTGYYPEAGMLLRQKKEMAWELPIIGGDATNNMALVDIAGKEAAAGYYFISPPGPADLTDEKSLKLMAEYQARHNTMPSSVWAVMAGDAFQVIAEALKAVEDPDDSAQIAEYLHNGLEDFTGFTGPLAFNEKGDRVGDVYRLYVVSPDGAFSLVP